MSTTSSLFSQNSSFHALNQQFKNLSLTDCLNWTMWTFGDKVAQVTSFGPSGMIILDQLAKINPGVRVITLDTGYLFPETHDLWQEVERRFNIQLEVHKSEITPLVQTQHYGPELWRSAPDQCCYLRKVLPLEQALTGLEAWITGIRRDQSDTRSDAPLIAWDKKHQMVKLNPLAYWDQRQIWKYIYEHKLPYNRLHDQGYTSVGCAPCTQPATHLNDERSGRWQGQSKTECGIHLII
ncbi:MAG: phosphoadenylyl-sulfate reductase [Chloroflexota bacterium]